MSIVKGLKRLLTMQQIHPALVREPQLARRALEEPRMQVRLQFDETRTRGRRGESELAPRRRQSAKICRFNKKPDVAEVVHDTSAFFENDSNGIPIIKWHRAAHNASHQPFPEVRCRAQRQCKFIPQQGAENVCLSRLDRLDYRSIQRTWKSLRRDPCRTRYEPGASRPFRRRFAGSGG